MALHLKSTGIDFADFGDATESSELFDDYEEGTWTGDNNDYAASSTVTDEIYVKVGNRVYTSAELHYVGAGNFNGVNCKGFPFTCLAGGQSHYRGTAHPETGCTEHLGPYIGQNSTTCVLNNDGAGAQRYNNSLNSLGNNGVYITIWYPTAT